MVKWGWEKGGEATNATKEKAREVVKWEEEHEGLCEWRYTEMPNLASQTFLIHGGGGDSLLDAGCHLRMSIYRDADFSNLINFLHDFPFMSFTDPNF
jgi:hypothetical protein